MSKNNKSGRQQPRSDARAPNDNRSDDMPQGRLLDDDSPMSSSFQDQGSRQQGSVKTKTPPVSSSNRSKRGNQPRG